MPVLLGTTLADATLRAALNVGTGQAALLGIARAEAIALLEETIRSMTHARLLVTTAAVIVGLMSAGAGVMGYSAARATPPQQVAGQPPTAQGAPRRGPTTKQDAKAGPYVIRVEIVDAAGHPMPAAEILAASAYRHGSDDQTMVYTATKFDERGQAQLEIARDGSSGAVLGSYVWAYRPGLALAAASVQLGGVDSPARVRLTLAKPVQEWTVTISRQGHPAVEGIRITPLLLRPRQRRPYLSVPVTIPDEWADRLAVTTAADGTVTLTCIPDDRELLAVRVSGPGLAPHALPVDRAALGKWPIHMGPPARLLGVVRSAAGEPLANASVEVSVKGSGTLPDPIIPQTITPNEVLRLRSGALKSGPDGVFQTQPELLAGSTYRVAIKHDGYVPFVSDWVTLDGGRISISPIRLEPMRKLTGKVTDRQGARSPCAGVSGGAGPGDDHRCRGRLCSGRHRGRQDRGAGRKGRVSAPRLGGRSRGNGRDGIVNSGARG